MSRDGSDHINEGKLTALVWCFPTGSTMLCTQQDCRVKFASEHDRVFCRKHVDVTANLEVIIHYDTVSLCESRYNSVHSSHFQY